MAEIISTVRKKETPLGVTSDPSMTPWLCNVALGLQPTQESLFLLSPVPETRFSPLWSPYPLRIQTKGIVAHILPGPQPPQEPGRLSKQACPGAALCSEWTGAPGDLALWQRWHHSVKRNVTGKAVIVCGMPRLSVCLLRVGCLPASCEWATCGSKTQASWSFLQLSCRTELITHLETQQPCPQPSDESESSSDLFPTCLLLHWQFY